MKSTMSIDGEVHRWFKRILAAVYVRTGKALGFGEEVQKAVVAHGQKLMIEYDISFADGTEVRDEV